MRLVLSQFLKVPIVISLCLLGVDMCGAFSTHHRRKGAIKWPVTGVGSRRIVRCPYAYDQPSYAHRDCVLSSSEQKPKWNDANVTLCPNPPFSQGVNRLASFTVSRPNYLLLPQIGRICNKKTYSCMCKLSLTLSQPASKWVYCVTF